MTVPRPLRDLLALLVTLLLVFALAACETGDESCCVGHVRGCVDDLDICSWQCDEQGAGVDCYADCIDVVGECAMQCED